MNLVCHSGKSMSAYACYNNQIEQRMLSSSGGIYFLLARKIIEEGGVVFAVVYNSKFETEHCEITKEEELYASLGSKYCTSILNDTFRKIKDYVKENKKILFVGTPCQCAGLTNFLGKDQEKVFLIDFVCHGVPSRKIWKAYLKKINPENDLFFLNMRDKTMGWSRYAYDWKFMYKSGAEKVIPQNEVPYMKGFVSDLFLRPSCYECRFKGKERETDITLGDYWGVWEVQPEIDDNKGTSIVMLHSEKGKQLFESISSQITKKEIVLEKVIKHNPSIECCAPKTKKRKKFFQKFYEGKDIEEIIKQMTEISIKDKMFQKGKIIAKRLLKRGGQG